MPRLLTAGMLMVGLPAFAQQVPTVAVVGLHQADLDVAAQRQGADALVLAIDDSGFFDARSPRWVADRLAGREAIVLQEAFLGPGRALLDEGRTLYGQAQAADAVPVLEQAVASLLDGMATARSTRDLWDAQVYLGAARLRAGDGRGAREAFEAAVALNPPRSLSAAEFPPDLVERYEDVRRERVALATSVEVSAGDEGTEVWVNGERRGVAPLVVDGVLPGRNLFAGRSPLGFTAFEVVDVPAARRHAVALRLRDPILAAAPSGRVPRARQVDGLYAALGESVGTDLILVAGGESGRATLQLYSPRTDTWSTAREIAYSGSAADELVAALPDLLVAVRDDATFEADARVALPEPLDVSANGLLARMLVLPETDLFADERVKHKKPMPGWAKGVVWGAVGAAVVGGAAWGTAWALTDPFQGTIVVRP